MAQITIEGIDELVEKLGRVSAHKTLQRPMRRSMETLVRYMKFYPPPISGSSYIRTDILKNQWTSEVTTNHNGLTGKVGNATKYAPWVQSSRFQAGIHRGRWRTDENAIDENEDAIIRDFQKAITKALSK